MGSSMARNLVAAGMHTTVWDRSPKATAALAAAGALVAASPRDAIRDARVVITMLPDALNSVIPDSLPAFTSGAVWAQMGTIGVSATVGFDGMLSQARPDVMFVDARCRAALKDVDLAIAAAEGTRLPMLEALSRQWRTAVEAGYGRNDVSAARLALGGEGRSPAGER